MAFLQFGIASAFHSSIAAKAVAGFPPARYSCVCIIFLVFRGLSLRPALFAAPKPTRVLVGERGGGWGDML